MNIEDLKWIQSAKTVTINLIREISNINNHPGDEEFPQDTRFI